ncbi:beta-ketoacyl-ACP synthase [Bartonella krasnovii]|uniref:Beta-ketoacyl-ACP synthase n=1 Tax=Bartonella krasnovii TaxID=2267275 RepID=A0ABY3VWG4_9HYPH|nr:beta-ketoacyl-ACP synthase [Bartonella krasnovii]UNF29729.1 beta-ketoacyl-ACP synthase [Bartonella krasnovii]UNF36089.1 beta-ketoacyl-ACP synthase [Bartonella krasnovii]UNF37744.1 beta-ketoacyl-ACP synthase [Bartonella krasnovii]UNF41171.1 beta-ketoacyl-ACP synthase [Bartonella krasnovii]UNF46004.1 beta-ketoacyl-ACP synthase [Bartonella krasnovii]
MYDQSVFITGIGLISSLGEGTDQHWKLLNDPICTPNLDCTTFSPYTVHKLPEIDWNLQIPKKSDQRQMGIWQRLGTYAAGLALDDAGMKNNEQFTSTMDMIVAASGGERDITVDTQILSKARAVTDHTSMLNVALSTELRPTLFLAQLSNLLAGNISIVHKVTGSSRTFMGEEGSGLSSLQIAVARIKSGQSTHALVGSSYNAQSYDMLLAHELGGLLTHNGWSSVWDREIRPGGGIITGSGGVFLVLESGEHAKKRNARAYAEISQIITDQTDRTKTPLKKSIATMLKTVGAKNSLAISAASGAHEATKAEQNALDDADLSYRGITTLFGYMREAQFPLALALAALSIEKKHCFPALSPHEKPFSKEVHEIFVTTIGIKRAEGVVHLTAV